ncbi:MAG: hypothetical protein HQ557_00860 [Bacteroidetes bacterium]|nr:hypothetical protein [Bacteroidota bacterium]
MIEKIEKVYQDKNEHSDSLMKQVKHKNQMLEKEVQRLRAENVKLRVSQQTAQNLHRSTEEQLHSVLSSTIWRFSKPYRFFMDKFRLSVQRRKSIIKKFVKLIIIRIISIITSCRFLKKIFLGLLNLFPVLKIRLKRIHASTIKNHSSDTIIEGFHSELNKDFNFIHYWLTHQRKH